MTARALSMTSATRSIDTFRGNVAVIQKLPSSSWGMNS